MVFKNNLITYINSFALIFIFILAGCGGASSGGDNNSSSGGVSGKAGSMSRFSIIGNYLYTISGRNLQLFSFTPDFSGLNVEAKVSVGWSIETLYSANNHLFIGAQDGVYIYNNSDPANPVKVSKFRHIQSCDPVIVNGDFAYVTLRSNSARCGWGVNRLDVLDISDMKNPTLVKSFAMQNPKGLGIANGLLFVCDDIAGLKIFNLKVGEVPGIPVRIAADKKINCYDLIPDKNNLVISDQTGILQYTYTANSTALTKISEILKINANTPK